MEQVGSRGPAEGHLARNASCTAARTARTFPASSTVVTLRRPDGSVTHFVGVQRDITEELHLRDQLVHSERLSAVGELVAGVAHEINNPLQTIIGCVELMIEERRARRAERRSRAGPSGGDARGADRPQPAGIRAPQLAGSGGRRPQPDRPGDGAASRAPPAPAQHRAGARAAPGPADDRGQPRGDPADRAQPAPQRGARHGRLTGHHRDAHQRGRARRTRCR